jgi:PKD repeat protein
MAISRVAGNMLFSDLDRQGVNLQFTTNNSPLFFLDFANFRAAINVDATVTNDTFTVNGSSLLGQIRVENDMISSSSDIAISAPNINVGDINGLHIGGGNSNFIMTTDGSGNLSWQDINSISQSTNLTGMGIILGVPGDSSLTANAAYGSWTPDTKVTNAIDDLNQVVLNVYKNTFVGNVDFTANVRFGPSPISVQFTPTVVGNATQYLWDFGDGFTSTALAPQHTFSNPSGGIFTVSFRASNPAGTFNGNGVGDFAENIKSSYIRLYTPAPIPAFTIADASINSGSFVTLTNTSSYADAYVIDWGDGTTTAVADNISAGSPGHAAITHTYSNLVSDTVYPITMSAASATAGPTGMIVTSAATNVRVYSTQSPSFTTNVTTGNNQHNVVPNGLTVTFTNTTATNPGSTAQFPSNSYLWIWGDGTQTSVNVASGVPGNVSTPIQHTYTLTDPTLQQTFNAVLRIYSEHTTAPFTSVPVTITVKPAPTAAYSGAPLVASDRTGDTARTGYVFTDLNGVNRATIRWTNTSINANAYSWTYGDGSPTVSLVEGQAGSPTGGTIDYSYSSEGTYAPSLLAHGPNSINASDDTLTKASYITIAPVPSAPANLSTKAITMSSVGTGPLLVANASDNAGTAPAPGTSVIRVTTANPISTSTVTDAYNATTGTLRAVINGVGDTPVTMTSGDDSGTYGALVVTVDRDAHAMAPATYPSNFYKVFSGYVSKTNATVPVGFNTMQISHSVSGNTNVLGFVKDDVLLPPTLDASGHSMTTSSLGVPKYISGVPYFDVGGTVSITGVNVYNWIGQTYLNSTTPLTVNPSSIDEGTGNVVALQGKTYAQIDGATTYLSGGIPKSNTGKTSGTYYALGPITFNVNGTAASAGKVKLQLSNVNGASSYVELPTELNVYSMALSGFKELDIPVSTTLGSNFTDNGKRIVIASAAGATPTYDIHTNYYLTYPFSGNIPVTGTDEAVVRFGTLKHDVTNYSTFLPIGPDLSGRGGVQYFRFAFRRATVANFNLTFTGKISGLMIALPGTQVDATSTLNGWLDATQVYAGAGVPGANTGNGGNGGNGCAFDAGNIVPTGSVQTNRVSKLTLGAANTSDSTGNQVLVSVALATGDYITSISIS